MTKILGGDFHSIFLVSPYLPDRLTFHLERVDDRRDAAHVWQGEPYSYNYSLVQLFFGRISYELLFKVWVGSFVCICMLEPRSVFFVASLAVFILGKKSLAFVSCRALSYSTEYVIWHCFSSCSFQYFNFLFHFKGFLVCFST